MESAKFTPGPWRIDPDRQDEIIDSSGNCVIWTAEIESANARLIAAAPDMYEALKTARAILPMEKWADDTKAMIDSTIAKAEGIKE